MGNRRRGKGERDLSRIPCGGPGDIMRYPPHLPIPAKEDSDYVGLGDGLLSSFSTELEASL